MDDYTLLIEKYEGKPVRMLCEGWTSYSVNGEYFRTQDFWIGDTGRIININPMCDDYSYAWNIEFDSETLERTPRKHRITSTFWSEFEVIDDTHPFNFLKEHNNDKEIKNE